MGLGPILDLVIIGLLIVTIGYAIPLNRRLKALRDAKAEMTAAAERFAKTTARAGEGLESLKDRTEGSGKDLQRTFAQARGLADDLSFLIERGSKLAERLDGSAARLRVVSDRSPGQDGADPARPERAQAAVGVKEPAPERSPDGSRLLDALQGMR